MLDINYKNESISFLGELQEREEMKLSSLKRKKEISKSENYDEDIAWHENRNKLIEYIILQILRGKEL